MRQLAPCGSDWGGGRRVTGSVATRPGSPTFPDYLSDPDAGSDAAAGYDELPDAVLVLDGDGHLLSANSAAATLLRLDLPGALGRPLSELFALIDERGNDWWECSLPLMRLPGVRRQPERRLLLADPTGAAGGERELLVTVSYVRDEGIVRRVGVFLPATPPPPRPQRSRPGPLRPVAPQ